MVGEGKENMLLALYVDDLPILWSSKKSLAEVKERLKQHFKMKDLGRARFRLGVEIGMRLERGYFNAQHNCCSHYRVYQPFIYKIDVALGISKGFPHFSC